MCAASRVPGADRAALGAASGFAIIVGVTPRAFRASDRNVLLAGAAAVVVAGLARYAGWPPVLAFVLAGIAVALLASLVARSVEHLGDRFGSGAIGVLQSALGNLPELFIGFFALKAGLIAVVQAAIIGSILSNVLLVLGLAFLVGGLRNGVQRFSSQRARTSTVLMVLATAALVLPSLAAYVHAPAAQHEGTLSLIVSIVLLGVFALSLPSALQRTDGDAATSVPARPHRPTWPLWLAVGLLAGASVAAALVSDWFVVALQPAIEALGISQAFAGLVIVAIAGNAIENLVGIQLAYRNQADFALSVIIQSPLQIALVLAPALVLLSFLTTTTLTLVFAPMLVVAVAVTVIAVAFIVFDGESTWLEGVTLIAAYAIIATTFWWG